jgi:hypothetical protein
MNERYIRTPGRKKSGVKTPEYAAFCAAIQACGNPNNPRYQDFGAKGISVDLTFEELLADAGRKPTEDHYLAQIDPKENFAVGNVIWITRVQRIGRGGRYISARKCVCHPERPHFAHGMCNACWSRDTYRHRSKKEIKSDQKKQHTRWLKIKKDPVQLAAKKKRDKAARERIKNDPVRHAVHCAKKNAWNRARRKKIKKDLAKLKVYRANQARWNTKHRAKKRKKNGG